MVNLCSCNTESVVSKGAKQVTNEIKVEYKSSQIDTQAKQSPKWHAKELKQIEGTSSLFFKNALEGWIGTSDGFVYRTADGGTNWSKQGVDVPKEFRINKIFFVNSDIGWLTAKRDFPTYYSEGVAGFRGILMKTVDGGRTWQEKILKENTLIEGISFTDENNGWLIGATFNKALANPKMLILKSNNGGESWEDISSALNTLLAREDGFLNEVPVDIKFFAPQSILILTNRGKVFETSNSGKSWNFKVDINDDYAEFSGLELNVDDKLYTIGSLDSPEGIYSIFGVEKQKNSWIRHFIKNISISEIKSLSKNELVACGSMKKLEDDNPYKEYRNGVIIYSPNKGEDWSIIYETSKVEKLKLIQLISPSQVISVGDSGEIISLTKE